MKTKHILPQLLVFFLLSFAFLHAFGDKICGPYEELVVGGEQTERICDAVHEWRDCKETKITHVQARKVAHGTCHCVNGRYRHSNGTCLTLKECGFFVDHNPCLAEERIVFGVRSEKTCDGGYYSNAFYGKLNTFLCFCPVEQIRLSTGKCIPIDECRRKYPEKNIINKDVVNVRSTSTGMMTPRPKINRCGINEVLVVDGARTEQLCDDFRRGCESIREVEARETENGTCHCVEGRHRHSNGSCLTLRECGYLYDETPCAANERTVLTNTYEKKCGTEYKYFEGGPKKIHCHCPDWLVRLGDKCVPFEECGRKIYSGFMAYFPKSKPVSTVASTEQSPQSSTPQSQTSQPQPHILSAQPKTSSSHQPTIIIHFEINKNVTNEKQADKSALFFGTFALGALALLGALVFAAWRTKAQRSSR